MRTELTSEMSETGATGTAWVIGGTGAIGSEVVRQLRARGLGVAFSYCSRKAEAEALASATGARAFHLQLSSRAALHAALDAEIAASNSVRPSLIVHSAAISAAVPLVELTEELWHKTLQTNAESVLWLAQFIAARGLAPVDVVVTGGLDRSQSLPLPVHYAATQGMLSAMVMALSHELGRSGVRINMVSFGIMEAGLSSTLAASSRTDYEHFSAMRRVGTASEAARVITWLGLENSYVQGKVISVNGGI
jgi:3-oxoacyl-[acyl-carrier protein] reductase